MWFKKKRNSEKEEAFYFTETWLNEWKSSLRSDDNYRKKGSNWNAPVLLRVDPFIHKMKEAGTIGFFLDLQYGECREMRFATEKDVDKSDVILSADPQTWIRLIEGRKDPTLFIMKGSLKLEKGSLVMLSMQKEAAKALLATAPSKQRTEVDGPAPSESKSAVEKNGSSKQFSTVTRGIDHESFPMKLFQKAKRFGIWDPVQISLEKDKQDWSGLQEDEKGILLHLTSLFMAGEEAVTVDLLPLIQTVASENRIEEEIFLTSFLWEEAKHTEFFSRFVNEVIEGNPDFESFHAPLYKKLFYDRLTHDLQRLKVDSSPIAQLKASGTYNMVVEGTLAETGYEAYYRMLEEHDLLPGLREGITKLKQDESRHIAFGIYFINRLLNENPELKTAFEDHLEELLDMATGVIHEIFEPYEVVPFGLEKEWFLNYAVKQFQHRIHKLGLD